MPWKIFHAFFNGFYAFYNCITTRMFSLFRQLFIVLTISVVIIVFPIPKARIRWIFHLYSVPWLLAFVYNLFKLFLEQQHLDWIVFKQKINKLSNQRWFKNNFFCFSSSLQIFYYVISYIVSYKCMRVNQKSSVFRW